VAKAEPDECYNGIGKPYPPGPPCSEGIPKVNQTYLWGMTRSGDDLWFASSANVSCLAMVNSSFSNPTPEETSTHVCEYGESRFSPPLPPQQGDWRPPRIYVYNTAARTLTEKTPQCSPDDCRIKTTMGIRSAGTLDKVVIFGGPCLSAIAGINLFAFRTDTGAYLGSTTLAAYADIRKWLVVKDVLYTAVRNTSGGGSVLRWRGSLLNPFLFEKVGTLDSEGVELAEHEGRLFVTTWPEVIVPPSAMAGLYMSPLIPPEGLTLVHAPAWAKVWQVDDYEPDQLTAVTCGGGALASFKGYLYWGTLCTRVNYGNPEDPEGYALAAKRSARSTTVFRGRNFGTSRKEIQLLYGEEKLWKCTPSLLDPNQIEWEEVNNNMGGAKPLYGPSGFGNPNNAYTWSMAVFNDQLFVGTLDANLESDSNRNTPFAETPGADLFRFYDSNTPAMYETWDGLGNPCNAGIRNMIAAEDGLYIGTAGPANLVTDPDKPHGGWELIRLTVRPPVPNVDPLPPLTTECGVTLSPPTATGDCPTEKIAATTTDPLIYTEPGTYTVTWTYAHGCYACDGSDCATQTQEVIIRDTQPPVPLLDHLPDITGRGRAVLTPPTAVDNCAGKITATTGDPLTYSVPGNYLVTWVYDDGHGYSTIQTQNITVELSVNIKPGIYPHLLNPKSRKTLLVVVPGSNGFDVASIDPASIRLSRDGVSEEVAPIRQNYRDLAALTSGGEGTALTSGGEGTTLSSIGEGPALPSVGEGPALPSDGEGPALPSIGEGPALPFDGEVPALPSVGQLPALPSVGEGPYDCLYPSSDGYPDLILDFKSQEVVRKLQLKKVAGKIVPLILTAHLKAANGGSSVKGRDSVMISFPWQYLYEHRR